MTETLATSGNVKLMAGTNVSTALTADQYTTLINEAEAQVCAETGYDWVDNYTTVSTTYPNIVPLLETATAALAALSAIDYDINNYFSKFEAVNIKNKNVYLYNQAIKHIKERKSGNLLTK